MRADLAEDEEIVRIVLSGDRQAFSVLVARYQDRLYGLGRKMLGNGEDALDFVQDVFLKAFRALGSFQGHGRFYSWLMGIAYRHGCDMRRSRAAQSLPLEEETPARGNGPEADSIGRLACDALRKAMSELPERYRLCLVMFFNFGLSYEEISRASGVPVNTLKSHVFRAKRLLREALKDTDAEVCDEV